jgi:hypothetical protein
MRTAKADECGQVWSVPHSDSTVGPEMPLGRRDGRHGRRRGRVTPRRQPLSVGILLWLGPGQNEDVLAGEAEDLAGAAVHDGADDAVWSAGRMLAVLQ